MEILFPLIVYKMWVFNLAAHIPVSIWLLTYVKMPGLCADSFSNKAINLKDA